MKYAVLIVFVLGVGYHAHAQSEKKALDLINAGNFSAAINELDEQLKNDPDNATLNYYMGVSLLNAGGDKSRAIPYLEKIAEQSTIQNRLYMLGRAYHFGYRFKDAIDIFGRFIKEGKGSEENLKSAPQQIIYCQNAIEIMKFPANVTIQNLGPEINTPYPEYFPFVPRDESFLLFNSRRGDKSQELPTGQFSANVYFSSEKAGKFVRAVALEGVNSYDRDEEVVGLSADGKQAIFYIESLNGDGDLYLTTLNGTTAGNSEKLPKAINSRYHEIAACLSQDGSEIYFASDMPGGYGGVDLYVVRRLPNGQWSQPQNLGPTINTEFDEDFPNLSPDGKVLFFSSKGHSSMGGYDIFKADWDPQKMRFGSVENMRFPINTPDDNLSFMMAQNGRYGYMSAVRSEGYGDLDIYRVIFRDVEPRLTLISGIVSSNESKEKFEEVLITVIDQESGEIVGDYRPNRNSWRYVMILPAGKYTMEVFGDNHEMITEDFEVFDKASFRSEMTKDIQLIKIQ